MRLADQLAEMSVQLAAQVNAGLFRQSGEGAEYDLRALAVELSACSDCARGTHGQQPAIQALRTIPFYVHAIGDIA